MTDITLVSLSLFIALITMMVAAEMGQRRRTAQDIDSAAPQK